MTLQLPEIESFLKGIPGFADLPPDRLHALAIQMQPFQYAMGKVILAANNLPSMVIWIYTGQVRILGLVPRTQKPLTLGLLGTGESIGWLSVARQHPGEIAIASTDVIVLGLPTQAFQKLVNQEPSVAQHFRDQAHIVEVFEVLGLQLVQQANGKANLKDLVIPALAQAVVKTIPEGRMNLRSLEESRIWYLSSGRVGDLAIGDRINLSGDWDKTNLCVESSSARFLGILEPSLNKSEENNLPLLKTQVLEVDWSTIPEAPPGINAIPNVPTEKRSSYPFKGGRGSIDAPLACFAMLAQYWNLPFRRDVIRRVLSQNDRGTAPSLQRCGVIAELMELRAQLVEVPKAVFTKLPTPFLIHWENELVLVYEVTAKAVTFAVPTQGLKRQKTNQWLKFCPESLPILLLEKTAYTPQKNFNLGWFWPVVQRHKIVLIEVLIVSFVVQLFTLANPLVTQIIIDKVLLKNSPDTLNSLGILLIGLAIFEALLSSFRTNLFVDTTNRIDISLGSQVIDHLLRLPLSYFDRRPVGELSTRVNELENIRSFLTGAALTVVLDAVFAVLYVAVMLFYSRLLTLVALSTIPFFIVLTLVFSPILRRLVRSKSERHAQTQSHLVEVLTGIQTVKAQNIELKARWQWQDHYSRFVSTGFNAAIASTSAASISGFLNKMSSLLLLWVGAHLVLSGELTLGELIAFRIIASYTTSPLLRLAQLWQNFQETALSLERLADILDHPQEVSEQDRGHIPLPPIEGAVAFRQVSFRFSPTVNLIQQVDFEVKTGQLIGLVGLSGSGKSTLMKLLMRLYPLDNGQILIDGYDIHKVELNSLRQQLGMVLQDSLLFSGTVQDNIALTRPDASAEEVVAAAKIAYAHDFIMGLPQGYNTFVGERGSALSGGQRQRIAIARAILQNPRILILDEATSALDYNAERQVLQNLAIAFRDRTTFLVTHRLKSLQIADHILMMNQGQVAERGTHDELMALKGLYYCLYQQQEMLA